MVRKKIRFRIWFVSVVLIAAAASAQQEAVEEQVLEVYQAPSPITMPAPRYPNIAAMRSSEGWVELSFMVSPEGRAYEIYVVENVGDESFVTAAISQVEESEFSPARIGGRPVDGSSRRKVIFELEGEGDGVTRSFGSRYRRFLSILSEAAQPEAKEALIELEAAGIHNHYEYAYFNLARYSYALRYGTPIEQMEYLRAALGETVSSPNWETPLELGAARESRRALVQLQLLNRYFAEAMDSFELMQIRGDDEGVELFHDAIERLGEFEANSSAYPVSGRINETGSWAITLLKTKFYLSDIDGTIEELKLRCETDYVFFDFDPELQYNVSDAAGECGLQVIGDPNTTFTLVQAR